MDSTKSPTSAPTTPAFLLLLSGLSSSGKTTISRHLRSLIPGSFILHEDDFFLADSKIPVTETGLEDWDCPEAINWEDFGRVLKYVKEHGKVPGDFKSTQKDAEEVGKEKKEVADDQDGNGKKGLVGEEVLEELRERVKQAGLGRKKVVIVEGFLMFHEESVVEQEADAKMLLRVDYETAKKRRENRGYLTIEGYWQDPPGYFDDIVWPNYVKAHEHLFENRQVDQELTEEAKTKRRIHMPPPGNMEETLRWAVGVLVEEYKRWENRLDTKAES